MHRVPYLFLVLTMVACTAAPEVVDTTPISAPVRDTVTEPVVDSISTNPTDAAGVPVADLVSVDENEEANTYTFAVTISSADTGCEQYADWWEVVDSQTGKLLYRRILAHSHVNEQPFTRSGGPVPIQPGQPIVIRAHMGGIQSHYGGQVLSGSVDGGFKPVADSLPSLETVEPLPTGCAF